MDERAIMQGTMPRTVDEEDNRLLLVVRHNGILDDSEIS